MYIDKLAYTGLEILINMCRYDNRVLLHFVDVFICDGDAYQIIVGKGPTVEDAAKDYYERIKGKTLVLHPADMTRRKEITII